MDPKPWGPMDPNSQHQLWSRWTIAFQAHPTRGLPSVEVIADNARRFFAQLFNSTVGRSKSVITGSIVEVTCEIEGPAAHDAELRAAAIAAIRANFVLKGFGVHDASVTVGILAGNIQDGKPPAQLIVMPQVLSASEVFAV